MFLIPLLPAAAAGAAGGTAAAAGSIAGMLGITSVTTAAIVNAAAGTALALGASYAIAKLTPQPKQPKPSDGSVEFKQPLPVRFFTYGKVKISGPVLFLELGGDATGGGPAHVRLLKIVAFGTRELAMMDPFYVDGNAITLGAGGVGFDGVYGNWGAGGTSYGAVWTHLGKDNQVADPQLIYDYAHVPGGWTSNHRLRGIPYAFMEFESAPAAKFQEAFPGGEGNVAAVGGVKVYDPRKDGGSTAGVPNVPTIPGYPAPSGSHRRTDPTTWEFSDNQRLCTLDWLTWPDGYSKSWDRIDWTTWIPQIHLADQDVPLKAGGTEKRYRVATRVSYDEPRSRVLHRLMQAGDQQLFLTAGGLIGSRGGVWQAPTVSLDVERFPEAHFTHGIPMMDRVNEFELTAMLPSKDYAEYDLEPWANVSDPEHAAGIVRREPLELTQVPSNAQAQRLAKIYMSKRNPRWNGQVRTSFAGLDALGQSAVNLSFDELDQPAGSFDGPFWINGKVEFLDDRTGLTFPVASADPAAYSWNAATEEKPVPGEA